MSTTYNEKRSDLDEHHGRVTDSWDDISRVMVPLGDLAFDWWCDHQGESIVCMGEGGGDWESTDFTLVLAFRSNGTLGLESIEIETVEDYEEDWL